MGLARSIAALFSPSAKPPGSDPRHSLGEKGERAAERHLRKAGYKILARNYRAKGGGEVDLVCRDTAESELVFVEVKTRAAASDDCRPADAVTLDKEALIARGARAWLRLLDKPRVVFRFDIVEVIWNGGTPAITQLKSAFILPEENRRR